jgi:hypothetical protein
MSAWRNSNNLAGYLERSYTKAAQAKVGHIVRRPNGFAAYFDGRALTVLATEASAKILVDAHARANGFTC